MKKVKIKIVSVSQKQQLNERYCIYGIRHKEDDWDMPDTVEKYVLVNRYGFIMSKQPLDKIINDKSDCYKLSDEEREIIFDRTDTGWFNADELFDCYGKEN